MSGKKKKYNLKKDQQELLKLFNNMFGRVIQHEVIVAVAETQNWDASNICQILSDMTQNCTSSSGNEFGLNSVSYDEKNQTADVVIESENPLKTISYSKMASNQPRNFSPSKTGTKKKQIPPIFNNQAPKSKKQIEIERVKTEILKGYQIMIILRGLPGSGKSTLARKLVSKTIGGQIEFHIYSTDDYFVQNGVYKHQPHLLSEAHNWNQKRVFEAAQLGVSPIIIDNTNIQAWEARPYAMHAVQFLYKLEVLEPNTPWLYNVQQLSIKNSHNVSKNKISDMKERYETFDAKSLLAMYNLQYIGKKPPILRRIPPVSKQVINKPKKPRYKKVRNSTNQNSSTSFGNDFEKISPSEITKNLSDTWESDTEVTWEEINPINSKSEEELPLVEDLISFNEYEMGQDRLQSTQNDVSKPQFSLIDLDISMNSTKTETQQSFLDKRQPTAQDNQENPLDNTRGGPNNPKSTPREPQRHNFVSEFYQKGPFPDKSQPTSMDHEENTLGEPREYPNNPREGLNTPKGVPREPQTHNFGSDIYKKEFETPSSSSGDLSGNYEDFRHPRGSQNQKGAPTGPLESKIQDRGTPIFSFPAPYDQNQHASQSGAMKDPNMDVYVDTGPTEEPQKPNLAYKLSRRLISSFQNTFLTQNSSTGATRKIETKEIGTNTSSLELVTQKQGQGGQILFGRPRSLTDSLKNYKNPKMQQKLMLEKGTMTHLDEFFDDFLKDENLKINFYTLLNLFPEIEEEILTDIYTKCQFDVNWTVDILLENGVDVSYANDGSRQPKSNLKISENIENNRETKNLESNESQKSSTQSKIKYKLPQDQETQKMLNDLFQIPNEHYSLHVLNIRNKKLGLPDPNVGESSSQENPTIFEEGSSSGKDQDLDLEYEDLESETENDFIEFNFGREFINQLENEFGNTDTVYLERFLPVMQVPRNLACQLHAIWMESMYCQMEMQSNIIQEIEIQDAELAKRLQEEEARALEKKLNPERGVPSLQEIMDMEIALAMYRSDNEQWKNQTPDDLALKMTRQKLFEAFPELDKNDLCEILQAHDNSFDETVQSLFNSIGRTENHILANIKGKIVAKNPINNFAKQQKLLEKTKNDLESLKIHQESRNPVPNTEGSDTDDEITICKKGANYYREKASYHLDARQKLIQKANDAVKKGQPQVAVYYLDIAKLHMQKYEIENSRAACAFLSEHSVNHSDQRILDLHNLYVKEAEQALAMFLDGQISKLQQINKPHDTLFIITGRGKNSVGGRAQIKPVVKKRLKQRKLKFAEMNPGCLKVIISKHSLITNDMKN